MTSNFRYILVYVWISCRINFYLLHKIYLICHFLHSHLLFAISFYVIICHCNMYLTFYFSFFSRNNIFRWLYLCFWNMFVNFFWYLRFNSFIFRFYFDRALSFVCVCVHKKSKFPVNFFFLHFKKIFFDAII